jgi:hypothetical protein
MPVSLFQASSSRMQLKPLPSQFISFYQRVEQELLNITSGMVKKTLTLADAKSRLMILRHGLTMQFTDAQGRVIVL